MCDGGDVLKPFKSTLDVIDPFGLGPVKHGPGIGGSLLAKPKPMSFKPPKTDINTEAAAAAAKHQQDLLALAFGLSDTQTTGAQGLGAVPKSLLMPKATLGGY